MMTPWRPIAGPLRLSRTGFLAGFLRSNLISIAGILFAVIQTPKAAPIPFFMKRGPGLSPERFPGLLAGGVLMMPLGVALRFGTAGKRVFLRGVLLRHFHVTAGAGRTAGLNGVEMVKVPSGGAVLPVADEIVTPGGGAGRKVFLAVDRMMALGARNSVAGNVHAVLEDDGALGFAEFQIVGRRLRRGGGADRIRQHRDGTDEKRDFFARHGNHLRP